MCKMDNYLMPDHEAVIEGCLHQLLISLSLELFAALGIYKGTQIHT